MDENKPTPPKRPVLTLKGRRKPDPVPTVPIPVAAPQESVAVESSTPNRQEAVAVKPAAAPKQDKPAPGKQPRTSDKAATELAEWLCQQSDTWRQFLPLNIGVIGEVYALLETHGMQGIWSKRAIHKTLYWHTSRRTYWENLLACQERYGLDGQVGSEVTPQQRDHARQELKAKVSEGEKVNRSNDR